MLLDRQIKHLPLLFLDTETTGLRPHLGDRIIEIAIARFQGERLVSQYVSLVNPQRPISPDASLVNGITDSDVHDAPTFAQIIQRVQSELEGAVVVAHNAPFDIGFLSAEYYQNGSAVPDNVVVDTLTMLRRHFHFASNNLQQVGHHLGISVQGHRALADVMTTREVFRFIDQKLLPGTLRDLLKLQGREIPWPQYPHARLFLPPSLRAALQDNHTISIIYRDKDGTRTYRKVLPLAAFVQNRETYLRAYCYLRQEERFFRLDRIVQVLVENR